LAAGGGDCAGGFDCAMAGAASSVEAIKAAAKVLVIVMELSPGLFACDSLGR
jgi:hypothetical protein